MRADDLRSISCSLCCSKVRDPMLIVAEVTPSDNAAPGSTALEGWAPSSGLIGGRVIEAHERCKRFNAVLVAQSARLHLPNSSGAS